MTQTKVSPIKTSSLTTQTFEAIRDAIFTGQFLPGEHLKELHLSRDLQVSQVVVREALVRLEHVGLVVRSSNRNTTVTNMSNREIEQRLRIREPLEKMAFIEAAPNLDADDIAELKRVGQEMVASEAKEDYFESTQSDLYFHRYIWEKADNEILYHTLNNVTTPLFAFLVILRRTGFESLNKSSQPHEQLISVLETKDPRQIENAVHLHIENSYAKFLESGISDLEVLAKKIV
ncbi:MAG TPA: GntR family transcriptional regulator [Pyrinomonadaceae bacterium]|jgi:DNA-binding GntR family transcriptional regulator